MENDAHMLEKIIDFKFDIKPHLHTEKTTTYSCNIIKTYIDDVVKKTKVYNCERDKIMYEDNYKNGKLHGSQYKYRINGVIIHKTVYDKGTKQYDMDFSENEYSDYDN